MTTNGDASIVSAQSDFSAEQVAKTAKIASRAFQALSLAQRNDALHLIHDDLQAAKADIIQANELDMQIASKSSQYSAALVKRLDLRIPGKFEAMCQGVLDIAKLEDPLGRITYAKKLDQGLNLYRMTCPIGCLLVIFEARPEVVVNITALALKSGIHRHIQYLRAKLMTILGNAAILKGGKESTNSFRKLAEIVTKALSQSLVPSDAIQLVESREQISSLLAQHQYIDLCIPRGSNELVRSIQSNTKIPVSQISIVAGARLMG